MKHVNPQTGETFWVPSGGGLEEGDESVLECARREVFEETGLTADLGKIAYLREFVEQEAQRHQFEVFLACTSFSGALTVANNVGQPDESWVQEVRFLSREEVRPLVVYPGMLKDGFWEDLEQGFPETKYLGVQRA